MIKFRLIFFDANYDVISSHIVEFECLTMPYTKILAYVERLRREFPCISSWGLKEIGGNVWTTL